MTIVQIQYFMQVAETLNFTRAAENLYVSQQVVSKHIKLLEMELGFDLFVRDKKSVHLTQGGQGLYDLWKRHEREFNESASLARLSSMKKKVRVGILDAGKIVDMILPLLQKLDEMYPDISWEYEMGSFKEIQDGLSMKQLDIVITLSTDIPLEHPREQTALLQDLELGIILSERHPLYKEEELTIDAVKSEVFYMFDETFAEGAADKILLDCERHGYCPRQIKHFANFNKLEVALLSGRGITVGYEVFFRNSTGKLKLFPIKPIKDEMKGNLIVAWHSPELEEIASAFAKHVKKR